MQTKNKVDGATKRDQCGWRAARGCVEDEGMPAASNRLKVVLPVRVFMIHADKDKMESGFFLDVVI